MIQELLSKFPVIETVLLYLACLFLIAQIVVFATPTKKDDKVLDEYMNKSWFKKIYDFIVSFAPFVIEDGKLRLNKRQK